jgi:hypothetical protein
MARPQEPNSHRDQLLAAYLAAPPDLFTTCQFTAYLNRSNLRFLSTGELIVSFTTPTTPTETASQLHKLLTNPVPLKVTVAVDEEYKQDYIDAELKLMKGGMPT